MFAQLADIAEGRPCRVDYSRVCSRLLNYGKSVDRSMYRRFPTRGRLFGVELDGEEPTGIILKESVQLSDSCALRTLASVST